MIRAFGILTCAVALGAAPVPSVTVHMHNMAFDPRSTTVQTGQTVIFQNDDNVSHNVTSSDMGTSGDIGPGKTFKYTFDKAGDYHYVCTYHQGMTGEIIVADK